MSIISASKINKAYAAADILVDVSFNINAGDRVGIVGANGAGKSTLMKILASELAADSGELFIASDISVGYLKQRDHFPSDGTVEEEMQRLFVWQQETERTLASLSEHIGRLSSAGADADAAALLQRYDELQHEFSARRGYTYKSEIRGILQSLAFTEDYLSKPVSQLSGGERTRLALAALLLQEPDVLLLDEPTNHLDIGTLKWLEGYLRGYKKTLIIISHDRYFLDRTVGRIFEIENHRLSVYEGNYSWYKERKEQLYQEALKHYEIEMAEIKRQEEMIRRFKEHNTEHLVKRAQSREKRLAQKDRPTRPARLSETLNIHFSEALQTGNDVVQASGLAKGFGAGADRRELFRNVDLDIKRGDRICLVGPNGIGKTTLLKIILGTLPADSGMLRLGQNVVPGYYDQEQQSLTGSNTVLEELHSRYFKYDQTELRSILGSFLFKGDDVFKSVADLSGGEKARLVLLKLMMSGANLLILDEPTNHLDIAAMEVFEDALLHFPGTMIIVSHDRYLLSRIPTAIYELGQDGISIYLGQYDYYAEKSAQISGGRSYLDELSRHAETEYTAGKIAQRAMDKQQRTEEFARERAEQAEKRRRERALERAEQAVMQTEEEVKHLEEELCRPEIYSDPQKGAQAAAAVAAARERLEKLYEEWMELQ